MPERAAVFERPYIALEGVAAGTAALTGYKQLQSMSLMPSVKSNVDVFTPQGYKFATVAAEGKEWTEIKMSGQPTYTEIIYALSSVMGQTTPTTVGASTKVWTFSIAQGAADNPATYTMEHGVEAVRVGQMTNAIFTDFSFKYTRQSLSMDGTLMGKIYRDDKSRWLAISGVPTGGTFTITVNGQTTSNIAFNASASTVQTAVAALSSVGSGNVSVTGSALPTGPQLFVFKGAAAETELTISADSTNLTGGTTPTAAFTRFVQSTTALALVPILPREVTVKMATTQAGLAGASAMTRVLECGWNIGGRFAPIWALNASEESWSAHVEKAPDPKATIKLAADSNGMPLLTNMRKGTTRFFEFNCVGDATESGQTYLFKTQLACKINGISDYEDADGLYAVEFGGQIAYDATWTHAIQCTVQNLIATL